jgi:hypothetical protein
MSKLYSITANQTAIAVLFHVVNRYVGNLPPNAWRLRVRNTDHGTELAMLRWGHAATATNRRPAGHKHSQYFFTALAWLAETGEPVPCAVQQFC